MENLFNATNLKGKRVKFIRDGRLGTVYRHKSQGRLSIVWDDRPTIADDGYLDEEFVLADDQSKKVDLESIDYDLDD